MAETDARRQGPRRSETSQQAILDATRIELAENGWRRFSVDSVAKRARASKQTIYRWWPSIGAMCVEAGLDLIASPARGARDPRERIAALALPFEAAARQGDGHAVLRASLMAAGDDEAAGERWRAWFQDQVRGPLRTILAELAAKHVITRSWDLEAGLEALLGPLWHRLIVMRMPVQAGYADQAAERILNQFRPD